MKKPKKKTLGGLIIAGLIAFDMFINGLTGGAFHETISLRAARGRPNPVAEVVCFVAQAVVFELDHCDKTLARAGKGKER